MSSQFWRHRLYNIFVAVVFIPAWLLSGAHWLFTEVVEPGIHNTHRWAYQERYITRDELPPLRK